MFDPSKPPYQSKEARKCIIRNDCDLKEEEEEEKGVLASQNKWLLCPLKGEKGQDIPIRFMQGGSTNNFAN